MRPLRSGKTVIEHLRRQNIEVVEVGDENQLFLDDDYLVVGTQDVEFVLGAPVKYEGNPVITPDRTWEENIGYATVLYDEEEALFKMWYQIDAPGHPMVGYALSQDGLSWEKPTLGVEEIGGTKENNIVFVSRNPPEHRAQMDHVFKDYSDPDPEKRYKMVLDHVDYKGRGITFAFSPDGIRWRQMQYNVLHGGFDTQNVVLWDDQRGVFRAYLRWWIYGLRHVRMAESYDLYHWSEPVWMHGPDEDDPPDFDIYTPGTVKYSAAPNVYVMLNAVFDHTTERLWCQVSLSRDGVHWRRKRRAFIPLGEEGAWDWGMIFPAPAILVKGDTMYMYYRGGDDRHSPTAKRHRSGVGCVALRKDGFIALAAGRQEGVITTKPLAFSRGGGRIPGRGRLYLNVKADKGVARVELCDLNGVPIPGFTRDDCDVIVEDSTAKKVAWNGNPVLEPLHGVPLIMKIYLRDAAAYSMKFDRRGDLSDPVEQRIYDYEVAFKAAEDAEKGEHVLRELRDYIDHLGGKEIVKTSSSG